MTHVNDQTKRSSRPVAGTGWIHIVTVALYAGFAIPVTLTAMGQFWVAGVGLAVVFAVFWPKMPKALFKGVTEETVDAVAHSVPGASRSSGNSSFDAYRTELLERLEKEQQNFEGFLGRLREAKDKAEFDDFMDDRARMARAATGSRAPELQQPGGA